MEQEKNYVAFIDVLGFKQYVIDHADSPDKVYKMIDDIQSTANIFLKTINERAVLQSAFFSDSLVFNIKREENLPADVNVHFFLNLINTLQCAILSLPELQCLPIRGGIAVGGYHLNEEKNIFFGEAFIRAYEMEAKCAKYPRIVVDAKDFDLNPEKMLESSRIFHEINSSEEFKHLFEQREFDENKSVRLYPVARDYDGHLFCNYLYSQHLVGEGWAGNTGAILFNHKIFIENNLAQCKNEPRLLEKYNWMKEYHNWFCQPFEELRGYIIK